MGSIVDDVGAIAARLNEIERKRPLVLEHEDVEWKAAKVELLSKQGGMAAGNGFNKTQPLTTAAPPRQILPVDEDVDMAMPKAIRPVCPVCNNVGWLKHVAKDGNYTVSVCTNCYNQIEGRPPP
jgi:hypothetical protein